MTNSRILRKKTTHTTHKTTVSLTLNRYHSQRYIPHLLEIMSRMQNAATTEEGLTNEFTSPVIDLFVVYFQAGVDGGLRQRGTAVNERSIPAHYLAVWLRSS